MSRAPDPAAFLMARCLEKEGVRHVFGVPGEENLHFIEGLRRTSIELVVTRHEQHAAFMAATWGRLTGCAGVCLATLGPGATNLLTGVAHAQLCGAPLVAITGQKPLADNWQGDFQQIDVVSMFRPVTKLSTRIDDADTVPRWVRYAFKTAEWERPGAVHLELPEDVAGEPVDGEPQQRGTLRRPAADQHSLDRAYDLLRAAEKPLLIVSGGANRARVAEALGRLVEVTGMFVVDTQMGKGVFPDDDPHSLFTFGIHKRDWVHRAVDDADLVVTLGYDVVEYPPSLWNPDRTLRIVHIDFNPAECDAAYNPTLEVIGDIGDSLDRLARRFASDTADGGGRRWDEPGFGPLRHWIDGRLHDEPEASFPPSPRRVVWELRRHMDRRDVVTLDNGIYKLWFARHYPTYAPNTLLLDNALGTMGAGLAMAMAAKMAQPDRRVVAVCGDGGFLMNSQDLETAVRLGLDLTVVVLCDRGYGFIRWKQQELDYPDFGMSFGNPDFVRYAEAYGARGLRVDEETSLTEALRAADGIDGPVLVECPVDYAENAALHRDLRAEVPDELASS